ncbi:hypothetical protein GJ744_008760 [Endocarpon pusillum]|uniref:Uncharacterized protein n=1 Tax=Endocarpon pusillum TaxID=364733 RepID=A0A8H7AUL4_9EURO|nr:hypothetical protein GJ744_008760 [Endocarpon pusillum]
MSLLRRDFTAEAVRKSCLLICMVALFASIVTGLPSPSKNITITVPEGTSDHGNPELICTPARFYEIALFYLGNYIAHAATLKSYPRESTSEMVLSMIVVLLFAPSGALRGLNAIFRAAVFKQSPIQRAARAGALCMVIRMADWKPQPTETIDNFSYTTSDVYQESHYCGGFLLNTNPESELKEIGTSKSPGKLEVITPPWMADASKFFWRYNNSYVPYGRSIHGRCDLP